MKLIKRKMLYMAIVALAGAGMFAAGTLRKDVQLSSMGTGMLLVAVLKLLQYLRMMKDPEKVRALEVVQTEERLVFLATKSAAITLYILLGLAYVALLALVFTGRGETATLVAFGACGTLIVYGVVHWVLNRKY